jgi:phospholipase/carboxylesterase
MHLPNIQAAGKEPAPGTKVLIMLHGRGGSAADILSLAAYLDVEDFALVAPQATGNTWYPYSFLAPPEQNEPWLSSALEVLEDLVTDLYQKGVEPQHLYFLGFSQGACLTLEFVARNAEKYGGVVAFTGGLIGDQIYAENYEGAFENTPVFIGTSNPDPHVPVERVQATTSLLKEMGAAVTEKIFPGMGHTISQEEIDLANKLVFHPQVEKS